MDRQVINYCGGGIAASADALALIMLGHKDVKLYDASLSEWRAIQACRWKLLTPGASRPDLGDRRGSSPLRMAGTRPAMTTVSATTLYRLKKNEKKYRLHNSIGYDSIGYDSIGYYSIGYDSIGYDSFGGKPMLLPLNGRNMPYDNRRS